MTTITTLQNLSLSQVGPFFPLEAEAIGVELKMIGFIISLNPIFYIIASLTMGSRLQKIGRKGAFNIGLTLILLQLLILGLLSKIVSVFWFTALGVVAQSMGGFGAGCNTTVCFSMITTCFPDDK